MSSNPQKRQRSENWLEEDKIILMELVKERVRVIENKNTDTNSNSLKVAAWNSLKESFNCMCKGAPRSVSQLKAQWGLVKMKEKKTIAEQRREVLKTGGGPPPVIKPISITEISSWLPNEFIIDYNEFDSDKINQDKLHASTSSQLQDMDGKENINNNLQEVPINVETVEALKKGASSMAAGSLLMDPLLAPTSTLPASSELLSRKPGKVKRKIYKSSMKVISPAEQISACEIFNNI